MYPLDKSIITNESIQFQGKRTYAVDVVLNIVLLVDNILTHLKVKSRSIPHDPIHYKIMNGNVICSKQTTCMPYSSPAIGM